MSEALIRLLKLIESIPDEVGHRVDEAFNSGPAVPAVVTEWHDYVNRVASFYWHLERTILGVSDLEIGDIDWHAGKAWHLLRGELGEHALQAGFERARTGSGGGMLSILRLVARLMGERCGRAQVGGAVGLYWRDQSADELLQDSKEYVRVYGHLLPGEMTERGAVRVRANFYKVLEQHPFMMRRMREAGRRSGRHGSVQG